MKHRRCSHHLFAGTRHGRHRIRSLVDEILRCVDGLIIGDPVAAARVRRVGEVLVMVRV